MVNIKGIIGNQKGEVNLRSVITQVQSEKENNVHVLIDSLGGDLEEAISIYNYLTSLEKPVTTESVNNCASAASIIFMAGSNRIAGCPIMIHNPYMDGVSGTADELKELSAFVKTKESEMEGIYSQYTTVDSKIISNLMDKETYISPSHAVSINLATQAKHKAIARLKPTINKSKMSKNQSSFKERLLASIRSKAKRNTVYNLDLTTADNGTLYVDRQEGEPQVGDSASPEGSHTMPDGSVIVVENGVITEIVNTSAEVDDVDQAQQVAETIEEIVEELQSEIETLQEELVVAKAQARTKEDKLILNAVKMAGGFDKVFAKHKTNYKPQARSGSQGKNEVQRFSPLREKINKIKEGGK